MELVGRVLEAFGNEKPRETWELRSDKRKEAGK